MNFRLRYLVILALVLVLLAIPLIAQGVSFVRSKGTTLNVRSGPGLEYGVIATIGRSQEYQVLDRSITGNWLLIDLGSRQGWVHQAYVNETNYNTSVVVNTAPVMTTNNVAALGQGGGFAAPQVNTQPTYGTGGPVYTYTYTMPTTTNNVAALGQGGGFAAPQMTTVTIPQTVNVMPTDFNSTIGSWVGLNMRSGPGMEYSIRAILPQGKRATPVGRNANGTWYLVDYNGVQGWVYMPLVAVPPSMDVRTWPVVG